jgi:alcohol dehydrogenase (cytochrome c)
VNTFDDAAQVRSQISARRTFAGALWAGCAFAAAALAMPPGGTSVGGGAEWKYYNGSLGGERFSRLTEINATNAHLLIERCRVQVAEEGSFQPGLLVVGNVMFATTATDTIAIDPVTCVVKWRHSYTRESLGPLPVNRGVAYLNGRVFRGTDDGHLIALNAATGEQVWDDAIGDVRLGEFVTGAPLAWNGLVFAGISGSEFGVRGRIMAFDALTGKELWRFHTIPIGNEPGADSWKDRKWATHGGGGTWSTFSLDESTGELFIPVGNPVADFSPQVRAGEDLFTNSVVVLDAVSGALRWWYQTVPNDAFDYDLAAAPLLYRAKDGQARMAVAGKDGYLHIVNREDHVLLSKTPITTVDAVQQRPTAKGVRVCPGVAGGAEWNGPAHDPERHILLVGAVDYCAIVRTLAPEKWTYGGVHFGGTWSPTEESPSGWITAVEADSGKTIWKYHAAAPVVSGVTATAGGIVLAGDNAGSFFVLDTATGTVLKKLVTGGALSGGVITYEQNGRQYIAYTSGNVSRTVFGAGGRPSIVVMSLPGNSANPIAGREADPKRGRQIYVEKCAPCHGWAGESIIIDGNDLSTVKNRMSLQELIDWIKNPKPPMPKVFPEPLNRREERAVRDIAAYLHFGL